MDSQETAQSKDGISWEVPTPAELCQITAWTLQEDLCQEAASAFNNAEVARKLPTEDTAIKIAQQAKRLSDKLKLVASLLQKPGQPIPIDHRYARLGGKKVIALDMVKNPAAQNPPAISTHK